MRSYHAFLSYNRAADGRISEALRTHLQPFARPWYRLRALRIFLDRSNLSASPGLWPAIQNAIAKSSHFILVASSASARSEWVAKELRAWFDHTTEAKARLLIVLTEGDIVWNAAAGDFDWQKTTALSQAALAGLFQHEPRWVDLRWARSAERLSLDEPRFREAILDVAAPLHGVEKDALASEEGRQHRRAMRLAWAIGLVLLALTVTTALLAVAFSRSAAAARESARVARRQTYAAAVSAVPLQLQNGNLAEARRQLNRCPVEYRHLEWGVLDLQEDPSYRQIEAHKAAIVKLEASETGRLLISADASGAVGVWNAQTRECILRLASLEGHKYRSMCVTISERSNRCAIWDDRDKLRIVDLEHGGTTVWETNIDNILQLEFTYDGEHVIATSYGQQVFDCDIKKQSVREILAAWDGPVCVAVDPQRLKLAASSTGGPLLLDFAQIELRTWKIDTGATPTALAFSSDGRWLACGGSDGRLAVINAETGEGHMYSGHANQIRDVSFDAAGRFVVSGGRDGRARVWSIDNHDLERDIAVSENSVPMAVSSQDIRRIFTVSADRVLSCFDGPRALRRMRLERKAVARIDSLVDLVSSSLEEKLNVKRPFPIVYSHDRQSVFFGDGGGVLRQVRASDIGAFVEIPFATRDGEFARYAVSLDGAVVATLNNQRLLTVWDVNGGVIIASAQLPVDTSALALRPDGRMIASASSEGIEVRNNDQYLTVVSRIAEPGKIDQLSFSSRSDLLLVKIEPMIKIIEVARAAVLYTCGADNTQVHAASWSQDGEHLGVVFDSQAQLLNARTGKVRMSVAFEGHSAVSLAIAPDRWHGVVGRNDTTASVFDWNSGKVLAILEGHSAWAFSVMFSHDGRRIFTRAFGPLRVWDAESFDLLCELPIETIDDIHVVADDRLIFTRTQDSVNVRFGDRNLATNFADTRARFETRVHEIVDPLHERLLVQELVDQEISRLPGLSLREQAAALALSEVLGNGSSTRLNNKAWASALLPSQSDETYAIALCQARLAVKNEPENAFLLNTLALAYLRSENFNAAIDAAQRTFPIAERLPREVSSDLIASSAIIVAMAREKQGNRDGAVSSLKSAQARIGEHSDADVRALLDEARTTIGP